MYCKHFEIVDKIIAGADPGKFIGGGGGQLCKVGLKGGGEGGTLCKVVLKWACASRRRWVREGDVSTPARSTEAFDINALLFKT